MVESATPSILKIAAWPTDLIVDAKGKPLGFVMPRVIARRDIHELYSPKSRADTFPEADFRFLVHVACNVARAFAVVHGQNHVLGDVNHGNVLVGPDGTVILIDCDSFQIARGAHVFTCDVGVPLFTPPELHGQCFRGLRRTPNHDRFGLAVLLFHLLCMGRHPFAGRYTGSGDMPIERAVAEYRFAYGPDRKVNAMERPPGTIQIEALGTTVSQLFIKAFGHAESKPGRPDARGWIHALENLEASLRVCSQASWHHYPSDLGACPWCAVEAQTGVRLFGVRIGGVGASGTIDLGVLWQAITTIPDPGADPELPSARPWKPRPNVKLPKGTLIRLRKALGLCLFCAGLTACYALAKNDATTVGGLFYWLAFAIWPRVSAEKKAEADQAIAAARTQWDATLNRWHQEASGAVFITKMEELKKARSQLANLPNERRRQLAKLDAERQSRQKLRYLDRFRIDRAKIKGIGTGRTAMLTSFGIETAADINGSKIMQIPGFGESLTRELTQWRRNHEQNFRFNPNVPVDRREIAVIDRALESRRQSLTLTLQQGPATLQRLNTEIRAARVRLMPVLEKAWNDLKIAEVRRNVL